MKIEAYLRGTLVELLEPTGPPYFGVTLAIHGPDTAEPIRIPARFVTVEPEAEDQGREYGAPRSLRHYGERPPPIPILLRVEGAHLRLPHADPTLPSPEPVLCYVGGSTLYFTTKTLSQQWGDDWNDAPYEHNAGKPYRPSARREGDFADGKPVWRLYTALWAGALMTPDYDYRNSPYSVMEINARRTPWLRGEEAPDQIAIWAGEPYTAVAEKIRMAGGIVGSLTEVAPAA